MPPPSASKKVYLGDGAFMSLRGDGSIVLTAENGIMATDTVVLEPNVLREMIRNLSEWGLVRGSIW